MQKTKVAAAVASLFAVALPAMAGVGVADESVFERMAANEEAMMPFAASPVKGDDSYGYVALAEGSGTSGYYITFSELVSDSTSGTTLTGGDYYFSTPYGRPPSTINFTVSTIQYRRFYGGSCVAIEAPNIKNIEFAPTRNTLFSSLAAEGNSGSFINDRDGTIEFKGGSLSSVYSYTNLATGSGSVATMANQSGGSIVISGGSASNGNGINTAATGGGTANIINSGGGSVTIQGGSASSAYGINLGSSNSGKTTLINAQGAVMQILGTESAFGINQLVSSSSTTITNAGTMVMNSKAIGSFGGANTDGTKSFINQSTGLLQAEVGTLFEGGTLTAGTVPISASFLKPDGSLSSAVYGSVTGNIASGWTLKSDWSNYAQFDAGGTIEFTNVTGGTDGAADIKAKFEAAFGTGTTVKFAEAGGAAAVFDIGVINTILASNPGAVFYDRDFSTEAAVTVGSAESITGAAGFRSLSTAGNTVTVADGSKLTLIGNGRDAVADGMIDLNNATLELGNANVESGGKLYRDAGGLIGFSGVSALSVGAGTFILQGGSSENAAGIAAASHDAGTTTIRNAGTAFTVSGGAASGAYGIQVGADGAGSVLNIENAAGSTFSFTGGTAQGVYKLADNGGTVNISNAGTMTFRGQTSNAVWYMTNTADDKVTIANSGTLGFFGDTYHGMHQGQGGDEIRWNGHKGTVEILNADNGLVRFKGTPVNNAWGTFVLNAAVKNQGTGRVKVAEAGIYRIGVKGLYNEGTGQIYITGGSLPGIDSVADKYENGYPSEIVNSGGGDITIVGGTVAGVDAIRTFNDEKYSTANVSNLVGTFNILGSDTAAADAVGSLTSGRYDTEESWTYTTLFNGQGAEMNILGNASIGSYGIRYVGDYGGTAGRTIYGRPSIINEGVLNLNSNGIRYLTNLSTDPNDNLVLFTNRATGRVNSESAQIFAPAGTSGTKVFTTTVKTSFVLGDGRTVEKDVVTGSEEISCNFWNLKDDWAANSVWVDGGVLNVTDIGASTQDAYGIQAAFEETFGRGTSLLFNGVKNVIGSGSGGESAPNSVGKNVIETLIGSSEVGSDFIAPSLVLDLAGSALKVGGEGGIAGSFGVQKIDNATSVEIGDAKTLTLVGDGTSASSAPIAVGSGSKLILGLDTADEGAQGGLLKSIANSGSLEIHKGRFKAETLTGNGRVKLAVGSRLTLTAATVLEGAVENAGTLATAAETTVRNALTLVAGSRYESTAKTKIENNAVMTVHGSAEGTELSIGSGKFNVHSDGKAHFSQVEGSGAIGNAGTLVADAGTVTGDVKSSGLTVLPSYDGSIASNFSAGNGSAVLIDTFTSNGVVRISNASMVIGTAARERWLLDHLEEAQKIVDAGGTVSQAVLDALASATAEESSSFALTNPNREATTDNADLSDDQSVETEEPSEETAETEPVEAATQSEAEQESEQQSEEPVFTVTRSTSPLERATLHGATVFATWDSAREDASALNRASADCTTGLTAELITGLSELEAYRVKRNGVRVGLQRADDDLTLGVQAGYADGKVKFGAERTRTDASFGVYARYHLGDAFVSGFAGYGHGKTEVQETSDIRTDSLFGGFMLGADVTVNDITFTPHVGITGYRITADDTSNAKMIEFPIGFSVKGTLSTASGWVLKPNADVSFVIGNGDRTVRTVESGIAAESVFAGRHRTEAAIGLNAVNDSFSVDVGYRGSVGDAGFRSHSLNVRALYAF